MNTTIKRRMRRLLGRQGHTTRITKSLIDKQPESGNQEPPRFHYGSVGGAKSITPFNLLETHRYEITVRQV